MRETEIQLLESQSNYEIMKSGNPSPYNVTFPASLIDSVKSKRVQHQREEQIRRDRLKRALQTLADVLPHKTSPETGASRRVSKKNNKAEMVERAIEHIRELHKKLDSEYGSEKEAMDGREGKD